MVRFFFANAMREDDKVKQRVIILVSTIMLISATFASGSVVLHRTFQPALCDISTVNEHQVIRMPSTFYLSKPGFPELPVRNEFIAIPGNCRVDRLVIDRIVWHPIDQTVNPRPQPFPNIISLPLGSSEPVISSVYQSDAAYPETPIRMMGEFKQFGKRVAAIEISPVRYFPLSGHVEFMKELNCRVEFSRLAAGSVDSDDSLVSGVKHRDDLFPYVIITSSDLVPAFETLAEWKTQKGMRARIVTVEEIDLMFPTGDEASKIRSFLKEKITEWSIQYVMLGGDGSVVPIRHAFAMDSHHGNNDIGADLYYSDLDGNWNLNGNLTYGELSDDVDMNPDIVVGRIPVRTLESAQTIVQKILTYEKTPPSDYTNQALFVASVLWQQPYTDSGIHKNYIGSTFFPDSFSPISKLYESLDNLSMLSTFNAMNAGGHLLNHDGHAGSEAWGFSNGFFPRSLLGNLQNSPRNWIVYSIGCLSARFEIDCMASDFLKSPQGGAVAYIGNFSYGWGMPGNPGFGVSDVFDTQFFKLLFESPDPHLGDIFALSKQYFVPQAQDENVFRWVEYELNLFGDPEMPVWTHEPLPLSVDYPRSITPRTASVPIWVESTTGSMAEATVCLYRAGECFEVDQTDASGLVNIAVPSGLSGPVTLTVTSPLSLPFQTMILLDGLPDLRVDSVQIADGGTPGSNGNSNGLIERNETIEILPLIVNLGSESAVDVAVILSCADNDVTVLGANASYGTISSGSTGIPSPPFQIQMGNAQRCNRRIDFTLSIIHGVTQQTAHFNLTLAAPDLEISELIIYDYSPGGNSDGILDAGESAWVNLILKNNGMAPAYNPVLTAQTNTSGAIFLNDSARYPLILPDHASGGYDRLLLSIASDFPSNGAAVQVDFNVETQGNPDIQIPWVMSTGRTLLMDDVDATRLDWLFPGSNNLWRRTSNRSHSGTYSYCCNRITDRQYESDMSCNMRSPLFHLSAPSTLRFWRWFDFPLYGADGLNIDFYNGSRWETIGFIGGGGALNLQSDWSEVAVPLPGANIDAIIRFVFVSDNTLEAEGIYIDDISIVPDQIPVWGSEPVLDSTYGRECERDGVMLWMPSSYYHSGQTMFLNAAICNMKTQEQNLDLYVALELFGTFYFAPGWTLDIQSENQTFDPGLTIVEIIDSFELPANAGSITGPVFWSALVDSIDGSLFGDYDSWELGWDAQ